MTVELIQGTDLWRQARVGSLGASRIGDALAKIQKGWGASRANVMAELVVERITGEPTRSYISPEMQWGTDNERRAKQAYSLFFDEIEDVGLIRHPTIENSHASPDGHVGCDGGVEVKCPNSSTHIETLLGGTILRRYQFQMQWQMACTGRAWCDFVSFDPRMPADLELYVTRVYRDDELIASLEKDVREFLAEVDAKVVALRNRQPPREVLREQLRQSL
jgi:YqaJ-like viral recombinase domain